MKTIAFLNRQKRYLIASLLTLLGTVGGYLYYRFIGCATGLCPITSNPFTSMLYGGVLGLLIGLMIMPEKKKEETDA